MFNYVARKIVGTKNQRELKRTQPVVARINEREGWAMSLSDEQIREQVRGWRKEVADAPALEKSAVLDRILPDAFALTRESGVRALGMRHFDVQLVGGMGLHKGLSVGCVVHGLTDRQRQKEYGADITYGQNNEFGFDYLRDNMKFRLADYVQRELHYAIVDEVDSILIDEARTPLIISGPSEESTDKYYKINQAMPGLIRDSDYAVDETAGSVVVSDEGVEQVE